MSNAYNEQRFYEALENVFTGVKIEGQDGFVNLLKIKSAYYRKVLSAFQCEVTQSPVVNNPQYPYFKEEFFDKLYTFFEKYFSESGSVYFVKTAAWQRIYEKVYTDNKDVVLFWKTHMLYYVKTDVLYHDIKVAVPLPGSKFAETLSLLTGLGIKRIGRDSVVLSDGKEYKINPKTMTAEEKFNLAMQLKSLLWGGE